MLVTVNKKDKSQQPMLALATFSSPDQSCQPEKERGRSAAYSAFVLTARVVTLVYACGALEEN